jgi:molecular chaperone GrpE
MAEETHEQEELDPTTNEVGTEDTENQEVVAEAPSAEDKYNELNDKYLRLYSEFDNYRRRTTKERLELFKTASQDILTELIPVLDDFERAQKALTEKADFNVLKQGVDLVFHKFNNTLTSKGLKAFESIGKAFDPDFHEAVTKIPAPSKKLRGKVVDEIEKGYMLNDKVIRFAKVVVGE